MSSRKSSDNLIAKARIKSTLLNARLLCEDPDKDARIDNQICKCCHYIMAGGVSMQAFTNRDCEECEVEMMFPTSDTHKYCLSCAKKEKLCKRCGADINVDADGDVYDALYSI